MTPPRQAAPATPPEEGNCRYGLGNLRVQAVVRHSVKRSLTPLHRRGIVATVRVNLRARGGWNFAGMTRLGEIGRCG